MKVIYDVLKINREFFKPVVAIGVFDGLHIGHRRLIQKVVQKAKKIRGTSIVLTFYPHPEGVLHPKAKPDLLATLEERIRLIKAMGTDVCIVANFTRKFSQLNPEDFILKYFVRQIHPLEIFVGHDFRFGKNRQGDIFLLQKLGKKYGFKAHRIPAVKKHTEVVSSSRIRKLVVSGDLKNAAGFLGRNVSVSGKVKRGDGRGKSLGFPTANIDVFSQVVPPHGVYATRVIFNKKEYPSMTNIGIRPSFHPTGKRNIEANIFGFHKSIYGKTITIRFIKKIRNEKKFLTKDSLIAQLERDRLSALKYFHK